MNRSAKYFANKPLIFGLGIAVVLLVVVQLGLTNYCASSGEQLAQLESRAVYLEEEIWQFEEEVGWLGSLTTIQVKAVELNFVKVDHVVYLSAQSPVAMGY